MRISNSRRFLCNICDQWPCYKSVTTFSKKCTFWSFKAKTWPILKSNFRHFWRQTQNVIKSSKYSWTYFYFCAIHHVQWTSLTLLFHEKTKIKSYEHYQSKNSTICFQNLFQPWTTSVLTKIFCFRTMLECGRSSGRRNGSICPTPTSCQGSATSWGGRWGEPRTASGSSNHPTSSAAWG